MNIKLLSICIPTYNRCQILDETLNKLFSNPEFNDELIEVIVSDNCSTDNTNEVVLKYPQVKYFRNDHNIGTYNFTVVTSYANGKYVKIFNDTFSFNDLQLGWFLNKIIQHENDNKNLFFYPKSFSNSIRSVQINSINDLFKHCSFHTTWSITTGFWKNDFELIETKNNYTELLFPQLWWMYSIVKNGKDTIIYFQDLIHVETPIKKGGYNLFKTFVEDYLFIVKNEKIGFTTYEIEKYRLCKYFIYTWLSNLFILNNNNFTFDSKGFLKILLKKYWYEPYFYPMLIFFCIKKFKVLLIKLARILNYQVLSLFFIYN
jgi:abequosyltransferase